MNLNNLEKAELALAEAEKNYHHKGACVPNRYFVLCELCKFPELYIEKHENGFLINKKFVLSVNTNKWRIEGRNKWYYRSIQIGEFIKKYVL